MPSGTSLAIPRGVSAALSAHAATYNEFMRLLERRPSTNSLQAILADALLQADRSALASAQQVAAYVPSGRFRAALKARTRGASGGAIA
jgi:hypothetical protein